MSNADLDRYAREQRRMLEDLDWMASEDSLVEVFVGKFLEAGLSSDQAVELSLDMLQSKGLGADIVERIAHRVGDGMNEPVSRS
jgi:hypothetical protein